MKRFLKVFGDILIFTGAATFFFKAYLDVSLRFQDDLKDFYDVVGLVAIAVICTKLEHLLNKVAAKTKFANMGWVQRAATESQNVTTCIMISVVATLFAVAYFNDPQWVKYLCLAGISLAFLTWLAINVSADVVVTSITSPIPMMYFTSAASIVGCYFLFRNHPFNIHGQPCFLDKEIMFRFAEAFLAVGGKHLAVAPDPQPADDIRQVV